MKIACKDTKYFNTNQIKLKKIMKTIEEITFVQNCYDRLSCETEMYATILTIIKGIMQEYIEQINKLQTPTI